MTDSDKHRIAVIIDELIREKGIASPGDISLRYKNAFEKDPGADQIKAAAFAMENDPGLGYFAPLFFDGARGGYFYTDPDYRFDEGALTDEEMKEISLAISLLDQFKYKDLFRSFSGVIQKLLEINSIKSLSEPGRNRDFIEFEKNSASRGSRFIVPLINAIENGKVVELDYQPFYEDQAHQTIVHPYLLKEYRFRWYLVGMNDLSGEIRTYGLDRVREINLTDRIYIPRNFKADEYFRNTIGVISPSGTPPAIRVRVDKPQAYYLISQPWHESQNIETEDENSVIFSFRIHPTFELKALIMSYGRDIEVVSPDNLREEIKKLHEDASKRYQ